jgi:hypothetical protein
MLSEAFEEAVRRVDDVQGTMRVNRTQTEGRLLRRLRSIERRQSERTYLDSAVFDNCSTVDPAERFRRDVAAVREILTPRGGLYCHTRKGFKHVTNVSRIVQELHRSNLGWVNKRHVVEAQKRGGHAD